MRQDSSTNFENEHTLEKFRRATHTLSLIRSKVRLSILFALIEKDRTRTELKSIVPTIEDRTLRLELELLEKDTLIEIQNDNELAIYTLSIKGKLLESVLDYLAEWNGTEDLTKTITESSEPSIIDSNKNTISASETTIETSEQEIEDLVTAECEDEFESESEEKETNMFILNTLGDDSLDDKKSYSTNEDIEFDQKLKSLRLQFQNGKVNQPYHFKFDASFFYHQEVQEYWFEGLDEIGLHYTPSENTIDGVPTQAGDH